ncbi:MAG: RNA-binding S4 domain-containing protein [Prevotella sp.]|nr:RNA-binding S4 domain-containing protein [Prevotella sp.]
MSEELENKTEGMSAEQTQQEGSREGYRPTTGYSNYRTPGRSPRPRIHTARPYGANRGNKEEEGGFRPEGFGAGLQQESPAQRSFRPRNNYGNQGGYQSRQGGYNQHAQQGGYRPRPNYNSNEGEGGYQPRQSGYGQRPQQGYRPRPNFNEGEGGYQPRQQGGYGQQRGGYGQQRGGYGQQRGGYDPNAKYSLKKRIEYKEVNVDPNEPIRLNKFLANAGICSRREADEFILSGAVTVNGQVVTELGTKVLRTDEVVFHGAPVSLEKKVYVLLNKPKDYVTTSDDPQQRKTVMDLVKNVCPERIYPVGRLDRNTTGVLLLTNDGDLASKLTHPKFLKKKVYHVFLDKNVDPQDMERIKEGIDLEDGEVHADAIEYCNENDKSQVGVEIHSGKNRIVRRIFESLGYRVVKLDRVQFAGLTKKNLRRGDWRFLTEKEVEMLRMGAFE